ncbi:hypothetical protein G6O67_003587 [Ophiocordyceps sinensis]|uniref:Uncharacterized protein n=1 Tax=Ophiocordyceps sinensis TaxID=72228 RepID=A0A8H4PS04_9HYPO|nr:hypothetical protein G6O67_003587 [Ophiocordyceps sinensis]
MHVLATALLSALIGCVSLAQAAENRDKAACPTVTSTATVCSTCAVKECLAYETISRRDNCPWPVATATTAYPCHEKRCPGGCAATSYVTAPPTKRADACPTVTSTSACSTCIRAFCVTVSTLSCRRGCPTPVPTAYNEFKCGGKCPGGCGTFYELAGCGGKAKPTA